MESFGLEEVLEREGNRAGRGKIGLGRAAFRFLFSGSRGSGTAVARGESGIPRSVLGPDECPRLHSPHSGLPSSPYPTPARLRGELRVGKCGLPTSPALTVETRYL